MTVSLQILPLSRCLDMYGEADTSTAYSLSGEVSLSLASTPFFFERPRPVKLRLESLSIVFEGQSELVSSETGYTPVRLCRVVRELAPAQAIVLSNKGHEEGKPCTWNFVFDLTIPGWLPASSIFGSDAHGPAGTTYGLHATAQFTTLDDSTSASSIWTSFCIPFFSKTKVVHADRQEISVNRYIMPPTSGPASSYLLATTSYDVKARFDRSQDSEDPLRIPDDILSKFEVLASTPKCIDMDEARFPFTLRLRCNHMPEQYQTTLKLSAIAVEIRQFESYRASLSAAIATGLPLPYSQPPSHVLISPHPVMTLCDLGLVALNPTFEVVNDSFSILPASQSGSHQLPGDGLAFPRSDSPPEEAEDCPWLKMEVDIPVAHIAIGDDRDWEARHGRVKRLRATEHSPLLTVSHELHIVLACHVDRSAEGLEPLRDLLNFTVPLKFVSVFRPGDWAKSGKLSPTTGPISSSTLHGSPAAILPPYSQLFHTNGDRKIDDLDPLPQYMPKECVINGTAEVTTDAMAHDGKLGGIWPFHTPTQCDGPRTC